MQDQKLERMGELGDTLIRLTTTDPKLSPEEIAIVLVEQIENIEELLRFYKKHNKQNKLI
jgi:hypothetical protein